MYEEIFAGLTEDPKQHIKLFNEQSNDEMVIVKDIPFYSMCEHHLLPFFGKAHIGYIPSDNKIIGLSKLARIVDNFAKKPQVQERLTSDIADFLNDNLQPKGVAVIMEAEHMCMTMRGARAAGSKPRRSGALCVPTPKQEQKFYRFLNKQSPFIYERVNYDLEMQK